jgi:hypothetical protein
VSPLFFGTPIFTDEESFLNLIKAMKTSGFVTQEMIFSRRHKATKLSGKFWAFVSLYEPHPYRLKLLGLKNLN